MVSYPEDPRATLPTGERRGCCCLRASVLESCFSWTTRRACASRSRSCLRSTTTILFAANFAACFSARSLFAASRAAARCAARASRSATVFFVRSLGAALTVASAPRFSLSGFPAAPLFFPSPFIFLSPLSATAARLGVNFLLSSSLIPGASFFLSSATAGTFFILLPFSSNNAFLLSLSAIAFFLPSFFTTGASFLPFCIVASF
mmetsp:Transcript_35006/g.85089  ORF Transcript_35006/g.85089 Transcript_35006/m.85089 type:complete len:205 (-) Transcript_35006:1572-2186(-)